MLKSPPHKRNGTGHAFAARKAGPRPAAERGFALMLTLILMVMLVVVAVGLLSLASISLRSGDNNVQLRTARANARLGMMLALAELQKEIGPDQRITASSGILEDPAATAVATAANASPAPLRHPLLTGVWTSRNEVLGQDTPKYGRTEGFHRWLVSSADSKAVEAVPFAESGGFGDPVDMVSARIPAAGTASTLPAVQADKIVVQGASPKLKGKYAWWVGDENTKGFLNPTAGTRQQAGAAVTDVLANTCTPGAHGMQALDDKFPTNSVDAAKILSHGQAGLASTKATAAWFHALSPFPRSVLCNVVKGGLRHDLSLFLEQLSLDAPPAWPGAGAPPAGPFGPNGKLALSDVDEFDVLPWKQLALWTRLRKNAYLDGGRPALHSHLGLATSVPNDISNPRWNAGVLRPAPVPVRCLQFVSFGTKPHPTDANLLKVRFYVYPVVLLWNPYNVDLQMPQLNLLFSSMPMEHKIKVNGEVKQTYRWIANDNSGGLGVQPYFDTPLTLAAGESKILTPIEAYQSGGNHIGYKMAAVPFNYGPTYTKGEWGNGFGVDPEITVTGTSADLLEIETVVKDFANGGASHDIKGGTYQTTFDIRVQHSGLNDAAWPLYQWTSKMGWRHQANTPSPSHLADATTPKVTFGSVKDAPRPFMVVDAKLKSLDETEYPNKTWQQCVPGMAFQGVTDAGGVTPYFSNAYKLSFETISSYQAAASYVQVNPANNTQGYFGGSDFPQNGQSFITDMEIPMAPLTSLAQLQNLPQTSVDNLYSSGFYFQNHAIGNSFASPGVPANAVKTGGPRFWVDKYWNEYGGSISGQKLSGTQFLQRDNIDRSYAANQLLWDDYFFSSLAARDGILTRTGKLRIDQVADNFYIKNQPLPNERYKPYLYKSADSIKADLVVANNSTPTGYQKIAASLIVDGGFNINSVSVEAWKTVLSSAHKRVMTVLNTTGGVAQVQPEGKFIVSRFTMPNGPSADAASGQTGRNLRWIGYRELTEAQIDALAHAIVRQVKTRGPFRSLGEFVNRRLGAESDPLTQYGALQAALEDPQVDINADYRYNSIDAAQVQGVEYANRTAATGSRYQGAPAYVTQADLLGPIAPILNARSDTFVIRSYGESTGADGQPAARAWCEAVVQRVPSYVDAADTPDTAIASLRSPANQTFGRKLNVVSFRWLSEKDI